MGPTSAHGVSGNLGHRRQDPLRERRRQPSTSGLGRAPSWVSGLAHQVRYALQAISYERGIAFERLYVCGAGATLAEGPSALFWNPAGIAPETPWTGRSRGRASFDHHESIQSFRQEIVL